MASRSKDRLLRVCRITGSSDMNSRVRSESFLIEVGNNRNLMIKFVFKSSVTRVEYIFPGFGA